MDPHRRDSQQSWQLSMVLLHSISPTPESGSQVFITVFDGPSPKCFAQPVDRQSCQANNISSALEKKKERFQEVLSPSCSISHKISKSDSSSGQPVKSREEPLLVMVGVRKNCPVTERLFKKTSKTSSKPRTGTFGAKSSKNAENKSNSSKRT